MSDYRDYSRQSAISDSDTALYNIDMSLRRIADVLEKFASSETISLHDLIFADTERTKKVAERLGFMPTSNDSDGG